MRTQTDARHEQEGAEDEFVRQQGGRNARQRVSGFFQAREDAERPRAMLVFFDREPLVRVQRAFPLMQVSQGDPLVWTGAAK